MASPFLPPPLCRSPRRWRFTWEGLAHIPFLRLFLFNPEVDPSALCANLRASLSLEEWALLVSWTEAAAWDSALKVPVPKVLVDPGSPVQFVARQDHIEVKLALVLPLDHPIALNLRSALEEGGVSDSLVPLSLNSDIKDLSAREVHFYCGTCCARLTRRPLRNFVEMPSANWREVADNWFGSCCCSFGDASEKLVHEYIKTYNCSEATCLLDGPSVTICKDDLHDYVFQNCSGELVECSNKFDQVAKREGMCGASASSEGSPNGCEPIAYLPQKMGLTDDPTEDSLSDKEVIINVETKMDSNKSSCELLDSSVNQVFTKEPFRCCVHESNNLLNHANGEPHDISVTFSRMHPSVENVTSHENQSWSHNGFLGSGFLIKASNLSKDVRWAELLCWQCLSLLGCYPIAQGVNDPVDGGVRLFKCCVSTSIDPVGLHNVFRKHTLERVIVNLLLESAIDELSFRSIVRDLRTNSPILKIVLLNSKAWCITGDCLENATFICLPEVNLQPVVKVLFSNCSAETEVGLRAIEQWVTKSHADEVYMMARLAKELTKFLKLGHDSLPPSYSLFQGMALSYIKR